MQKAAAAAALTKSWAITSDETTLFNSVVFYVSNFSAVVATSIIFTWLYDLAGILPIWALALAYPFYIAVLFSNKSGAVVWLIGISVLPLGIAFAYQENWVFAAALGALVGTLTIVAWLDNRKSLANRSGLSTHLTLRLFLATLGALTRLVRRQVYDKKTSREWRGMVISIIVVSVIILPRTREILPGSAVIVFEKYLAVLDAYRTEIVFGVFILYAGFLCVELINFMARALTPNLPSGEKMDLKKRVKRLTVLILFFLGFVPGLIATTLYITVVFLQLGRSVIGDDFALLLGFFVFPLWMATFLAFIGAVFLLIVPLKMNTPGQSEP